MDNNINFEKYALNGMVDNTIQLLNQVKAMIETSKNNEDLDKAKTYAEYAINELDQQLKTNQKTKSR